MSTPDNALPFLPEIATSAGEHDISFQAASMIDTLLLIRRHFVAVAHHIPSSFAFGVVYSDIEAALANAEVDAAYEKYFANPEYPVFSNVIDGPATSIKCDQMIDGVRAVWLEKYYKTRTREATTDDFQRWFDGYVGTLGDHALSQVVQVGHTFGDIYHPLPNGSLDSEDRGASPLPRTNLRIATDDIQLIQGYRNGKLALIAPPNLSVLHVMPNSLQHAIFSQTGLSDRPGHTERIILPSDISL
ncbi:MAG: hypothetical protein JWM81_341 [Candidatus Saccharibacteria bacterium]|nr:hypothetical protein [Candidatus Saccharibacteria bacterium]